MLTGQNGQISLGHGALMAIGAYAMVKFLGALQLGAAARSLLALSAIATAVAGVLVGAAAARLRGPYLAGATLALAVGLPALADRFSGFLGGDNGLLAPPPTPPLSLGRDLPARALAGVDRLPRRAGRVRAAGQPDAQRLRARVPRGARRRGRRPTGRATTSRACRSSPSSSAPRRRGWPAGCSSSSRSLAAPGAFPLTLSVGLLTGVVLGGLGSLAGAVWGAAALVLVPTWADDASKAFSLSNNVQANLALAIYGVVLIVVMLAAPCGIQGALRRAAGPSGVPGTTTPRRCAAAGGEGP